MADLQEVLAFGNHKGASSKPELLRELISGNVKHGYGLVLPWKKTDRIPHSCIALMNIMHQFTLNASGDIINKERLTHNQSFHWKSGSLVNQRIAKEKLQQCMYGRCLTRLLCWIVKAQWQFPGKHILLQKNDIKLAYRHCHLNATMVVLTITQLPEDDLCILVLRLTCGGTPCPFEWSISSVQFSMMTIGTQPPYAPTANT